MIKFCEHTFGSFLQLQQGRANAMKTLLVNPWILTMNDSYEMIKDGYVWIRDDRIAEVGKDDARVAALRREADKVIEAEDKILMPGMVNAHTHMFQTFMRGLADDKPLFQWLQEEIWPFSALMTPDDFYYAALLGCIENLKTGATSVIDQHYIYTDVTNGDKVFVAMRDSGIRGNLCRNFANIMYNENLRETDDVIVDDIKRLHAKWDGGQNGRLGMSVGPINPWSCSPALFKRTKALSRDLGIKFQVHTAETQSVVERTAEMYDGMRNVEFFESMDILDEDTQLVHSVWFDDNEMALIAKRRPQIIHCPVANMYLASGVARVPEFLKMGNPVALATDGPGSNNSQDMLSTLKYTACLHKIHTLNAQALYPRDVLTMATRNGALAMGMEDKMGRVAPGMKADLVLVDWKKPHIAPVHKPDSALVYNANGNDVDTVLVDGIVMVENKKSTKVDEVALIEECQQRIAFIKAKM